MTGRPKKPRDPTERLPWVKWYHRDWRGDPRLRIVGPAARGLWMDMLSIMDEGEPYGHLVTMGRPMVARDLAALVGGTTEREVAKLLQLLESAGVFSRTPEGTIFSRRMVRDRARSDAGRANGALGGNPSIVGAKAEGDNPEDPEGVNPQVAEGVNPQNAHGVNPVLAHAPATQMPEARKEEESFALSSDRGSDARAPKGVGGASPAPLPAVTAAEDPVVQALAAWEAVCVPAGLSRVVKVTDPRRRAILARLRDDFGWDPERWRAYLRRIAASDFLTGSGERRWKAELDWALKPANVVQVQEGKYDNRGPANGPPKPTRPLDERYWDRPPSAVRQLDKPASGTPERLAWDEAQFNRSSPHPVTRKSFRPA